MIRRCAVCGKIVREGMTDDDGLFYCHEDCFEQYMDDRFGKHEWMKLGGDAQDSCGGYYIVSSKSEEGFSPTGIYYTEWDGEEEEKPYERPMSMYQRTEARVLATGNKWAIENFYATHC